MKIFVLDVKAIICYWLIFAVIVFFVPYAYIKVCPTVAQSKELPIYSVEKADKVISVTFDTAWGNEDIDEVIQILGKYDCSATFFVVGDFIDKFPNSVKALSDAGHEIANHSNSHAHFNNLSKEKMILDMNKCDEKIKNITGKKNVIFRAPYGEYNDLLVKTCLETNRYCIQWDVDSQDWMGHSTLEMKNRILSRVKNGSIILLHTGIKNTIAALPEILTALKNEGYKFEIVSNLILKDNYNIDYAGKQIQNN